MGYQSHHIKINERRANMSHNMECSMKLTALGLDHEIDWDLVYHQDDVKIDLEFILLQNSIKNNNGAGTEKAIAPVQKINRKLKVDEDYYGVGTEKVIVPVQKIHRKLKVGEDYYGWNRESYCSGPKN
jgi:hypothetical protein